MRHFVFDQPINAASFTAWVEQQLCPTLKPGDVKCWTNLRQPQETRHQSRHSRQRGARLLFLPPYSPDLNPIEQIFSKV